MNEQELKQWAWDWAIRLKGDLSRTPDFFREGEQIAQKQKDPLTCSKFFVGRLRRIMNTLPGIGTASEQKDKYKQRLTL